MIWGFYSGNIYFIVEILLAELIFLYPVPKRKLFPLRLGMAFAVMIAVAAFTPRITVIPSVFNDLFRFLFLFALSVVTMGLCFKLEFGVLLSMCSAGYAVQHIRNRIFHFRKIFRQKRILQKQRYTFQHTVDSYGIYLHGADPLRAVFRRKRQYHEQSLLDYLLSSCIIHSIQSTQTFSCQTRSHDNRASSHGRKKAIRNQQKCNRCHKHQSA